MNQTLIDLEDLFSNQKDVLYSVLKRKQNLILDSFYTFISFDEESLKSLKEGFLPFKKLLLDPSLIKDIDNYQAYYESFNNLFRVIYFDKELKDLDSLKEGIIVKVNFNKINQTSYLVTFPNFFKTVSKDEIKIESNLEVKNLLKFALNNLNGDSLLILDQSLCSKDRFYLPYAEEIYLSKEIEYSIKDKIHELFKEQNIKINEV